MLTQLLNDLGGRADDIVLVLDDYHVIDAVEVQQAMAFLLDHLPPRLHLVLVGRADPALPLARLRARGELVETRAADLRFTADEAAAYLNEMMGLELSAGDVTALEGRTEGWIAALQLAALSMQGRDDVAGFIAGFAGDDRYVVDYLVEEVLQRQSEEVQAFLLETSILGRMTGPLCDAVTHQDGGKAMLEALDRGNLFLVPLDDRRQWYRYHHLFADVLHARLLDEQSDRVPDLHRRASQWHEQNGEVSVAIDHALAARDFERAADLLEAAMPAMRKDRREAALCGWLDLLPDEVFRYRPVLSIGYVGALLSTNQVEGVESRLQDAERWLGRSADPSESTEMVVVDWEEYRRVPGWVALYRAALAMTLGDPATTLTHARAALDVLEEDDDLAQGAAAALVGLASWAGGDLEGAHAAYTTCTARMSRQGHIADVLGCSITLADLRVAQGRLGEAMRTYDHALQLAAAPSGPVQRGTADMYVGKSAIHLERNELEVARQLLLQSQELGEHIGLPQNLYRWRVAMAGLRRGRGRSARRARSARRGRAPVCGGLLAQRAPGACFEGAGAGCSGEAGRRARLGARAGTVRRGRPQLPARVRARHPGQGAPCPARQRSTQRAPSTGPPRSSRGCSERPRLAAGPGASSRSWCSRRSHTSCTATYPRRWSRSNAHFSSPSRRATSEGSSTRARPMMALLEEAGKRGITPSYTRRLLSEFGAPAVRPTTQPGLVDPLSERELDVLRLLGSDLGGPEIARELVVSLNTVRTHTRNIYAKLGVNNRRAAVSRAAELDLMSRSRRR